MNKILIGIPTLNEARNVTTMIDRLEKLAISADFLFVDDSSSDGTGEKLDQIALGMPHLQVIHRSRGLGIGSAHKDIVAYAYDHGYEILITLDCDFCHQPEDIPKLLSDNIKSPMVVGSRFLNNSSLEEWNLFRKALTHLGHFLTKGILKIPVDATAAFRLYRLKQIPRYYWRGISANGYAFFFESMFVLQNNGIVCEEISIYLPKRVYGESKLTFHQAFLSFCTLCRVSLLKTNSSVMPNNSDGWNQYWKANKAYGRQWYALAASIYRRLFIVDRLHRILKENFAPNTQLAHIGCGGGEVDLKCATVFKITGIDFSPVALEIYQRNYPTANVLLHNILQEPLNEPADGLYSLGLVEHFSVPDIVVILNNMYNSVKESGKVVLFWPHQKAPSVFFLKWVTNLRRIFGLFEPLLPPEPSLLKNREMAQAILEKTGWKISSWEFDCRDLWIQASIVLEK